MAKIQKFTIYGVNRMLPYSEDVYLEVGDLVSSLQLQVIDEKLPERLEKNGTLSVLQVITAEHNVEELKLKDLPFMNMEDEPDVYDEEIVSAEVGNVRRVGQTPSETGTEVTKRTVKKLTKK